MKDALRREWQRLARAARAMNRQTLFVLTACVALIFVQFQLGSRDFFREELAYLLPVGWRRLGSWGWWFGMQGLTGFVVPALSLVFLFGRRPAEIGLGRGDWKLAVALATAYLPLVVVGTWFLSAGADFQAVYPHYRPAVRNWSRFLMYEALFLFYWMGWEYLWRGFVLFGTAPTFGRYAIFVQMVPFALLHFEKPPVEAFLSILGGIALGALVWRCRAFWIAVPIHAAQMIILDLWCTLRLRTGIDGVGLDALFRLIGAR